MKTIKIVKRVLLYVVILLFVGGCKHPMTMEVMATETGMAMETETAEIMCHPLIPRLQIPSDFFWMTGHQEHLLFLLMLIRAYLLFRPLLQFPLMLQPFLQKFPEQFSARMPIAG